MKFTAWFIPDWWRVLTHAWSVRLLALSILLDGVEMALPYLDGVLPVRPGFFGLLAFLTTVGAGGARFLAQSAMQREERDA